MVFSNEKLEFNNHGFADLSLGPLLKKVGDKFVKCSVYCPARNDNSKSKSDDLYPSINFSQKVGEKRWDNISFNLQELIALQTAIPSLIEVLSFVNGGGDKETCSHIKA
ncbi:hypothetical protein MSSAC_2392 [Methanosarcina siciliae C2J]|uniref:Uncharacterized protein n=1 Tax=Methanosarcina siciliae C2J TaxID=1434118 RepID=A0A0E3PP68_9EURY|nr:hypothetical protein [Methanosarcina siciliae]AKB36982.1 hypothetical protein MSSAC_2392 [Methanosarcina siciliae C2J]